MIVMNILENTLKHKFFIYSLMHFLLKNMLEKSQIYFLFSKSFPVH